MIKRDSYLRRLVLAKWNGLIKVVTGIRRCGKSYLLNQIFYKHLLDENVSVDNIIKLPLDDDLFEEYRNSSVLSKFLKRKNKEPRSKILYSN